MTPRAFAPAILLAALLVAYSAAAEQVVHTLSNGATLTTDAGDEVIVDRETLDEISVTSQGSADPTLEAFWATPELDVFLNNEPIGYVEMDDWDELDVDALWDSYVEGARGQSETFGYEIKPLRWIIEPTLDQANATAYYAFEVQFGEDEPLINMIIMDFGRRGYEELTVVQSSRAFQAMDAGAIANRIAGAYEFGPQSDYADFRDGDTVAAVGAGGLIAAALGVKFGKGFLVVALLFLKKFWFLALIIPAAIWKFVTGRKGQAET